MDPITLGLAAGGALIGAIGSASNRRRGRDTTNAYYDYAEDFINSQAHSSIFDTAGGRALLKNAKSAYADNLEATYNRAVAGGATQENLLAARQANNELLDKVQMQLLQSDEARRNAWEKESLNAKANRANALASSYYQAAQDWQSWGAQIGNAALAFGSSNLLKNNLGGLGSAAES